MLPLGTWSDKEKAENNLFALLSHVASNEAFVVLHQLAKIQTKDRHFLPNTHTICTLMAQALTVDLLAKSLTPMDMVLLYVWVGGGCGGLQLKAVSCLLLVEHFILLGLKLQGLVAIAYLHKLLYVYFCSLNILEIVELWLNVQPAMQKCQPLVVAPHPLKLLV